MRSPAPPFSNDEPITSVEGQRSRMLDAMKKHRPSHKDKLMEIVLISHSKHVDITRPFLTELAATLEVQLYQHYAPFWQSEGVKVSLLDEGKAEADLGFDQVPLVIFDSPDQAGALGYHSITPQGKVYGRVFVNPILESGGSLSKGSNSLTCTASHEALEIVGDPYANFWADMDDETEDALELCDRTENDSYEIDGIAVSNFLGPRAFREGPGPYDWMRLLETPFEVRPGGYAIRRTGGPSGKYHTVWGRDYPEHKKALKELSSSRLNRRQAPKTA